MLKTIIKSNNPVNGVRQLVRQDFSSGEFENPIEEMDIVIPDKGQMRALWLKVNERIKTNIEIEKKKSYLEGKEATFKEAKAEVALEVQIIQGIVNTFADNTINAVNSFEQSLVKLSIKVAEKIIKKKIEDQDDVVTSVVQSAIKLVKDSSEITVLLNPNDFEILSQYEELNASAKRNVIYAIDEGVESGGCKIHSDWGVIDAQIDTQLNEIYTQLVAKSEAEIPIDSEHVTE